MHITKYGPHPRQVVASWTPASDSEHGIIFIHGGLYRDPSNTYADWEAVIKELAQLDQSSKLYSIDYQISPDVKHPSHIIDSLKAIKHIVDTNKLKSISLVGHSVGATLITQILTPQLWSGLVDFEIPKVAKVWLLDGIYDIATFVEEYPVCETLIEESFDNYKEPITPLNGEYDLCNWRTLEKIMVVQSTKDELLSMSQSEQFTKWLENLQLQYQMVCQDFGLHNQVYINLEIARLINLTSLS